MRKNDLRVWGLWSSDVGKLLFVSVDRADVVRVRDANADLIYDLEILRFDLSQIYKDHEPVVSASGVRLCDTVINKMKGK